jgi:probable O-glycosylation ligase (exosortase A-associated)
MLRTVFVFLLIATGLIYAVQGPFYALLFYLWNAYFRPEQWVWDSLVSQLHLSFIIGIYLVAIAFLSARVLQLNLRTGLVLAFFAQTLLSTILSEHPELSWPLWSEFAKVLLVSYLIVILVTDRQRFRLTLLVMALSLGFECAKQGWAETLMNPGAPNTNESPFLGDNNGVALGTMMLVPILGALAQTATRRWEAYLHRFLLVGVFLRGICTYSRGGFLAASALGVFSFAKSTHKIRALASIATLALLVSIAMPPQFWDRMQTITAPDDQRDASQQSRLHFWQVATTMANASPLVGVGFGAFPLSYPKYNRTGEYGGERAVHSIWFGALSELGYPGLLLFMANWSVATWSCSRLRRRAKRDPARRDLAVYANGLTMSLVVFAVAGSFLPHQYNEMFWHFIGLSTALHVVAANEVPVVVTEASGSMPLEPMLARP